MLRVAAMLAAALLATIDVACYNKPDAPQLGQGPDSGGTGEDAPRRPIDASTKPIDAAPTGSCPLAIQEDFTGPAVGCPINFLTGSAGGATINTDSTLNLVVPSGAGVLATCTSTVTYNFAGGVEVQIVQLPSSMMAQTTFAVKLSTTVYVELVVRRSSMGTNDTSVSCMGGTPMNSVSLNVSDPFFAKISNDPAAQNTVTVGVSSNAGGPFSSAGQCAFSSTPGAVSVALGAAGGSGTTDTVKFDDLEACN